LIEEWENEGGFVFECDHQFDDDGVCCCGQVIFDLPDYELDLEER